MRFLSLFAGTVLLRPYVFAFLAVYLLAAVPAWGWRRTGLYLLLGYLLAWAAEYSSIHNGFPFGLYSYISGPTSGRELWVQGVPFMDSLSFVFLSFAGLQTARFLLEPLELAKGRLWRLRWADGGRLPGLKAWLLAGLLTMGLDVVIDPVALQGGRWFLGRIYSYPSGGPYFGVPLSNFVGWALVGWAITGAFLLLERALLRHWLGPWRGYDGDAALGIALFAGVLAFNLTITFAIGEVGMALVGCLWSVGMLWPALARVKQIVRATSAWPDQLAGEAGQDGVEAA